MQSDLRYPSPPDSSRFLPSSPSPSASTTSDLTCDTDLRCGSFSKNERHTLFYGLDISHMSYIAWWDNCYIDLQNPGFFLLFEPQPQLSGCILFHVISTMCLDGHRGSDAVRRFFLITSLLNNTIQFQGVCGGQTFYTKSILDSQKLYESKAIIFMIFGSRSIELQANL